MNFMEEIVSSYEGVTFVPPCADTSDFGDFARHLRTALKKECAKYGLTLKKFNRGYFEISAFLQAPSGKLCYLHISDVRDEESAFERVLYRAARDEHDFTGGMNHFAPFATVVAKAAQLCE